MINLADKQNCTGCSSCANVCPHRCITMAADEEGFLQPAIDRDKCVECGLCVKRCPVLNPMKQEPLLQQEAYALISEKDRKVSSSGGAFSVFARYVLSQGGVVFGASIDSDFQVRHIFVEDEKDLELLRGSKYVQSSIGSSYRQAKRFLSEGRKVLFAGTPCQIAGLYAFLGGKRYENLLITLDLVCHGVPSQGAFDAYLEKLKKKSALTGGNMKAFRFRKFDSWDYRPAVELSESGWRILSLSENAFMNAFFEGVIFRESCFRCKYCNTHRTGTYTLADFWGIGRHGKPFKKNVACGVSLVIDNRGGLPALRPFWGKEVYIEKRSMDEAVAEQTNLKAPMPRLPQRDYAVKELMDSRVSLRDFSQHCGLPYKVTLKYLVTKIFKDVIYAFGLYNVYKTISYKIGKS